MNAEQGYVETEELQLKNESRRDRGGKGTCSGNGSLRDNPLIDGFFCSPDIKTSSISGNYVPSSLLSNDAI